MVTLSSAALRKTSFCHPLINILLVGVEIVSGGTIFVFKMFLDKILYGNAGYPPKGKTENCYDRISTVDAIS